GLRPRRANNNPALRPPIIGQRRRILDQLEPQHPGKELNGLVVVVHHNGNQVNSHQPENTRDTAAPFDHGAHPKTPWNTTTNQRALTVGPIWTPVGRGVRGGGGRRWRRRWWGGWGSSG